MRWFVLSKGGAEGQEFKWYYCDPQGHLIPEEPVLWKTAKGYLDINSNSVALIRAEPSVLTLIITKLLSADHRDFAGRVIYTHLIVESDNAADDAKLQALAAEALGDSEAFQKKIDAIIRPAGEEGNKGLVVDRRKLSDKLNACWKSLKKNRTQQEEANLRQAIEDIVFDEAKLGEPLRDKALFDRQLTNSLGYLCGLFDLKRDYGKSINRSNAFITVIEQLVNYLEIGFVVDGEKLHTLTAQIQPVQSLDVLTRSKRAKTSDERKHDLAQELRDYRLPDTEDVLIVVTHNVSPTKFVNSPKVCRLLTAMMPSAEWQALPLKKEPVTPEPDPVVIATEKCEEQNEKKNSDEAEKVNEESSNSSAGSSSLPYIQEQDDVTGSESLMSIFSELFFAGRHIDVGEFLNTGQIVSNERSCNKTSTPIKQKEKLTLVGWKSLSDEVCE